VDFYRRLAAGLRERGIEPVATLYHWDLPEALQHVGGWGVRDTAERFADYAELMARELGDAIGRWITHNEPWVATFPGHAFGAKAPGLRDWPTALRAAHHLLLSHGLAVERLRVHGAPEVGITLNLTPMRPASDSEVDRAATVRADGHYNRWFLDPLFRGSYPADLVAHFEEHVGPLDAVRDGDLAVIASPIDFLGVNYYFPGRVVADPERAPLGLRMAGPQGPPTAMGWEVDPSGLRDLLLRLRDDAPGVPLLITENGAAYEDPEPTGGVVEDPERLAYLQGHLAAVADAVEAGADVRAYFAWSLLDNFEWEHGYAKRFGLVHVDYATQRRTVKRSGLWYRDFISARFT
jgi:beta-glucosidase